MKDIKNLPREIFLLATLTIIISCSTSGGARKEVVDGVTITYLTENPYTKQGGSAKYPDKYVVKEGDSVFSIAQKYNLDYKDIAAANNLGKNYVVRPGQELTLRGSTAKNRRQNTEKRKTQAKTAAKSSAPVSSSTKEDLSAINEAPPPLSKRGWIWPFSRKPNYTDADGREGVYIISALGAKVRAVNNGRVVYVGDELEQYGKLILISHSDNYLSVYGQTSDILVKNDQIVKRGQEIAVSGNAYGNGRIYFEMRKNGNSIDTVSLIVR